MLNAKEHPLVAPDSYSHLLAGVLNALCGLFWTTAYCLYVRQAREDECYGMPLLALVLNLTWEMIYTFVYPLHGVGRFFHFPWVFIDGLLVIETLKHGWKEWQDTSPFIAENFSTVVSMSVVLALSAQWTFARQFSDSNASFWSAYVCQNVLSWGSVWMVLSRGHVSGHSMPIWWCRFLGSLFANLRYLYRVHAWPQKYGFIAGAFSAWILWMPCVADLFYPIAYHLVVGQELGTLDLGAHLANITLS
ncbi:Terpene cyclase pyr4 [Hypsizygus marmoreus]|uniref:Terpene cyclase pyr4 n=1 Tax=Hypsizygus marmoreus TaxID=39966 RepID=A0A369JXZ9_HYPMA|nr:Terpene cyclase pyr4 [Hypsizygus marmoreus]